MPSGYQTMGQLVASLHKRGGARVLEAPRPQRPVSPPPPPPRPLGAILTLIQDLAAAHAWAGEDHVTYNRDGNDQGLHVILVREVLLFAEIVAVKGELSLSQQHWLAALRATGQCEVYEWGTEDVQAIKERLSRPRRRKEGPC